MQLINKSRNRAKLLILATTLYAAGFGNAQAGVVFTTGVIPAPETVQNVRFLSTLAGVDFGPDTTVTGRVGNMPYLIDFSADELMLALDQPAGAGPTVIPPSVRATDGALRGLDIRVRDGAFTSFFYNLRLDTVAQNPAGRFANVQVTSFDGSTSSFTQQLFNGNNLLFINVDNDALLRDISVTSSWDLVEFRQFRVGGLQDAPVPEPGALLSFGLGGLILWGLRSRGAGSARVAGQS